jgi:DNA-binding CsgD family transcriptional regulator
MAWALTTLARVELALQRPDAAAERARTVAEIADGKLQSPQFSAAARQIFAEAALTRGEAGEAERLAHEALETALEHLCRPAFAPLLDLLARCAAALDSFRESARILGAVQRSRADSGRVRWAHEQDAIAALDLLLREELGEKSHLQASSEGRDMSMEEAIAWLRRSRGSRKRPAAGWDSLTPTELQVVEFASRGLTNPEIGERMFISRGTVKVHLSHIYAKLDVRNRSQLAAVATRRPA